ncbi:MAG: exonuclease domain-containing protein [Planctomycetota bacterium]|nr:exonuclease domain-containing protein [Planctomycetota bacterium]
MLPCFDLRGHFDWKYHAIHYWHVEIRDVDMSEATGQEPEYWLVIDLEATCCNDRRFPRAEMEIIEIGAVIADGKTLQAVDEFQSFVRPVRHSVLTDFCRDLTGIQQDDVDSAPGFREAMDGLTGWMRLYPNGVFCSWGDYDQKQFARDCSVHEVEWPFGDRHVNLKMHYADRFPMTRGDSFATVFKRHDLKFEGRPHRGIDDARNIVRLLAVIFST